MRRFRVAFVIEQRAHEFPDVFVVLRKSLRQYAQPDDALLRLDGDRKKMFQVHQRLLRHWLGFRRLEQFRFQGIKLSEALMQFHHTLKKHFITAFFVMQ